MGPAPTLPAMERPWSYYLLLIAAWLAGLWGLWLIGEAWVNWPIEGPGPLREATRGRVWTGAGLLGVAAALGGLASIVRLLHDGVAAMAQLRAADAAMVAAPVPVTPPPQSAAPEAVADMPRAVAAPRANEMGTEPPRLVVGGAIDPAPEADRRDGPRLDISRRDAPRRGADDPPGRREPKLVPDA